MEAIQCLITGIDVTIFYIILMFIGFDVITGLLAAAAQKKLNSSINYIGIIRKIGELVAVAFCVFLDFYLGTQGYVTKLGVGMVVVYEGLSVVENLSKLGLDVKFLTKYFDKNKIGKGDK